MFPYYSLPFGGFPQPAVNGRRLNLADEAPPIRQKKNCHFFVVLVEASKSKLRISARQKTHRQILPIEESCSS